MKMTEKDSRTEDNINCQRDFDQDDEINLLELWQVVWKRRKFIAYFAGIVVVLTAVVSLFMTNIYESNAVITPVETKGGAGGGMAAALAAMGGGLGGMIGTPESATSSEIVLLLNSNILREKIIKEYNLLPVLFSKQWDEEKKTWKKGGFSLNPLTWISKLIAAAKPADKKRIKKAGRSRYVGRLAGSQGSVVQIESNVKEKSITISAQFDDPEIAASLAGYFVAALNDHMSQEARRVAAINKEVSGGTVAAEFRSADQAEDLHDDRAAGGNGHDGGGEGEFFFQGDRSADGAG